MSDTQCLVKFAIGDLKKPGGALVVAGPMTVWIGLNVPIAEAPWVSRSNL